MRIAFLSAHSCPVGQLGTKDTGGMSVYIRELACQLGKLGHQIDIFTRVHDPADPLMENLNPYTRLIHFPMGGNESIAKLDLFHHIPEFTESLVRFRNSQNLKYDLIFSHYWLSGLAGREVQVHWQVPHLIMFHTLGSIKNSLGIGYKEPDLRIYTETELARSAQRVIAATEREKSALVDVYGVPENHIAVVPCGVNLQTFQPIDRTIARHQVNLPDKIKIVLYAGRIEALKGIDRLLNAFAELPDTSSTRLLIIGGSTDNDPELKKLKSLACRLGIADSVSFLGAVKHEIMPSFYNAADVCVVPSHYESFGLVALEALACGTPVVATNVGVLRKIIQPGLAGYVIPERTAEGLADRIRTVLERPQRNQCHAQSIRATVNQYAWSAIAARINNEFQKVLTEYHTC